MGGKGSVSVVVGVRRSQVGGREPREPCAPRVLYNVRFVLYALLLRVQADAGGRVRQRQASWGFGGGESKG